MLNKRILVLMFLLLLLPLVGCFPPPTNQAPILTSDPITTATIGIEYVYDVNATDPDGDTLVYSLAAKPTNMTINSATGLIKWTPVATQVGDNSVTVKVSDGSLSITQSFTIKVSTLPPVNQAPVINSTPNLTATVGVKYTYTIKATDPEGDTITYSLFSGPTGMTFDGIATISWIPILGQAGANGVIVKASDGKLSTPQSFTIMVSVVELELIVIKVVPKTMSLIVGESKTITSVTAHYSDGSIAPIASGFCTYASSATSIATVINGVIEAIAEGTAIITVSYGGKSDTLGVTVSAVPPTIVTLTAIHGVTAPVTGGTPVETITPTAQYTGTVTWDPEVVGTFAVEEVYTATITLTAKAGYTLTGVTANFFTVDGADATNPIDSGVVTAAFPVTEELAVIDLLEIPGVTTPVVGIEPDTTPIDSAQYTGVVAWTGALDAEGKFAGETEYTATIILEAKVGFTLTGVAANSFTVNEVATIHAAGSGLVTAVFPETDPAIIDIAAIPGVTAPATGAIPVTEITETPQYTGTITWLPADVTFAAETVYTATITLTAGAGYTLTGVAANFFTVAGAVAINAVDKGVVTALFPATTPALEVVSAAFTSPTTLVIVYSEAVTTLIGNYTNGLITLPVAGAFTIDGISGSGTDTIELIVEGTPAIDAETEGTIAIADVVSSTVPTNILATIPDQVVTSGF